MFAGNFAGIYIHALIVTTTHLQITMGDDPVCVEATHGFFEHSETLLVGYRCNSTVIFAATVGFAFFLVIVQNFLATKDGQASRQALLSKRGSTERRAIVWKLVVYTAISSLLGTLHVLLVVGANIYILLALLLGNVIGVFVSYSNQAQDLHDPKDDLCAILRAVKKKPGDEGLEQLKSDMRAWLTPEQPTAPPVPVGAGAIQLLGEQNFEMTAGSGRLEGLNRRFAPYRDSENVSAHQPSGRTPRQLDSVRLAIPPKNLDF